MPCGTTSRVHPALKTGYAASHPAEFGLSSPGKPEATLRPSGIEEPSQSNALLECKQVAWAMELTLAKRSVKRARQ